MERNHDDVVTRTETCKCPTWSLRNRAWTYRGEGNASLVLAIPKEKIIVRLAKIDTKLRRMDSDYQFVSGNNVTGIRTIHETLERLEFGQRLLAPLLGYRLVSPLNVFHIDVQELEEIEKKLEAVRPAHRMHKKLAPVCHTIVSSDCTLLPFETFSEEPVFCVELKPKQGFLSAGRDKCPFCLKQFLKQQLGKISVLSEYCPLDLFSGSLSRMTKALVALTQTPQNNLRIFKNGNLVFGEDSSELLNRVLDEWFSSSAEQTNVDTSPLASFCYLIIRALTSEIAEDRDDHIASSLIDHKSKFDISPNLLEKCLNDAIVDAKRNHAESCVQPDGGLPQSCVLQRLLGVQKLGDLDFEQLYASYDHLTDQMRDKTYSYENLRWTNPEITASWLKENVLESENMSDELAGRLVQRYRIYSTARDCSIMIAFQEVSDTMALMKRQNRPLLSFPSGKLFTYHISIVDVDPKPVTCVDKHRRRDRAMSDAFRACASQQT